MRLGEKSAPEQCARQLRRPIIPDGHATPEGDASQHEERRLHTCCSTTRAQPRRAKRREPRSRTRTAPRRWLQRFVRLIHPLTFPCWLSSLVRTLEYYMKMARALFATEFGRPLFARKNKTTFVSVTVESVYARQNLSCGRTSQR
jgi:hypothetical protein